MEGAAEGVRLDTYSIHLSAADGPIIGSRFR